MSWGISSRFGMLGRAGATVFCAAVLCTGILCVWTAPAPAQESAPADTVAAETPAGGLGAVVDAAQDSLQIAQSSAAAEMAGGFLTSWERSPSAAMKTGIRTTKYDFGFNNTLLFGDKSNLSQTWSFSHEDYRSQDKTVDKNDLSVNYRTDASRLFTAAVNLTRNWSEDEVTNSSGQTNTNTRDARRATATLKRDSLRAAGAVHQIVVDGSVDDQKAVQQRQRNDIAASRLSGALRSGWHLREWLGVRTGAYRVTESGERSLGQETNPSSTDGDSLRFGVYYDRGDWFGGITVRRSSFEKRYLDYRRNSNGVIDTIGVAQKVVEELERNDATTVEWQNTLELGRASLDVRLAKDFGENDFARSGVGRKERSQDTANVDFGLRVSRRDSMKITYGYQWKWDDQRIQGGTKDRGKQINYRRDVKLIWRRDLFANTDLTFSLNNALTQDIAVGEFNKNDRDRLDSSFAAATSTSWPGGLKVDLSFDARRTEDISIQSERSGNNSIKDTYELAPGYSWPATDWLTLSQVFRLWIEYTDYTFAGYEGVSKTDGFNRRGNLDSQLTLRPNRRLTVKVKHSQNVKLNGEKSRTDAAGNAYYYDSSSQTIHKVNLALDWEATDWLTLEATTFKARDLKKTFGDTTRENERFSGDLAVGGSVDHKFAGGTLTAGVSKIFAHGPNVQAAAEDYWDADIRVNWSF